MQLFRRELKEARDDQVVKAELKGRSQDGSHYIFEGHMAGWKGKTQMKSGTFER